MTLFQSRHDKLRRSRFPVARLRNRLGSLFKAIHEAIVIAKKRRLRRELTFHCSAHEDWASRMDTDAAKTPRYPLNLGDKWDF
jgi:hypothetical protein